MKQISQLSTQYLPFKVTATAFDGTKIDPSGDPVQIAIVARNTSPVGATWHDGLWLATSPPYIAGLLIGPGAGGVPVAPGQWDGWVKITNNPEVPVVFGYTFRIY